MQQQTLQPQVELDRIGLVCKLGCSLTDKQSDQIMIWCAPPPRKLKIWDEPSVVSPSLVVVLQYKWNIIFYSASFYKYSYLIQATKNLLNKEILYTIQSVIEYCSVLHKPNYTKTRTFLDAVASLVSTVSGHRTTMQFTTPPIILPLCYFNTSPAIQSVIAR